MTTTLPTLTRDQHLAMAEHFDQLASQMYDRVDVTHDRAESWTLRREAERLVETANFHYSLAGA